MSHKDGVPVVLVGVNAKVFTPHPPHPLLIQAYIICPCVSGIDVIFEKHQYFRLVDSHFPVMQWKFDAGDGKNVYFLCFSIAIRKENCRILSHFQASGNAESQELPQTPSWFGQ